MTAAANLSPAVPKPAPLVFWTAQPGVPHIPEPIPIYVDPPEHTLHRLWNA